MQSPTHSYPTQVASPSSPADVHADRAAKVMLVHERLCREFDCPVRYFHRLDALSELISALLSHRTRNADSAEGFRRLRERFATWDAVRDAPTADVQEALAPCTWPEQKAPRVQAVLTELQRRGHSASLDFLGEWPVSEARRWLETLPGVGPKTSAAVISFSSLRGKALPVDSHHYRVASRLGLIPSTLAVGPAHRILESQLPEEWDAQQTYDHHQVMMKHGKRTCTPTNPGCQQCVIFEWCPYGKQRPGKGG